MLRDFKACILRRGIYSQILSDFVRISPDR
nr:MAG TPA: hypothetical protein [Caudoviricetes sp.]